MQEQVTREILADDVDEKDGVGNGTDGGVI